MGDRIIRPTPFRLVAAPLAIDTRCNNAPCSVWLAALYRHEIEVANNLRMFVADIREPMPRPGESILEHGQRMSATVHHLFDATKVAGTGSRFMPFAETLKPFEGES